MNKHITHIGTEKKHRASRRMLARLGMIAAMTAGVLTGATPLAQTGTMPGAAAPTTKPAAKAENPIISEGLDTEGGVKLMVNKTIVLKTRVPYKRVSLGTAEVADINTIGPQSILLTAKKAGTTQLIIWDDDDRSQVIDVLVVLDLAALQDQIKTMFPGSNIEVASVNGAVALRGRVSDIRIADQVEKIARPYSSVGNNQSSVLNMLEISGGQQVMLKVRFAEVSRSAINNLGVNFGFSDGDSFGASNAGNTGSNFGIVASQASQDNTIIGIPDPSGGSVTQFGKIVTGSTAIAGFISALRSNGLLRTLAEPDLVAISGQEANFLAGGEIPIPVSQGSSGGTSITIEYKKFGVLLKFVPVVLGNGNIRLRCAPEVSELDFSNALILNGFRVPALTNRSVETTVEMHEGQTLAIGGLLTSRVSTTADSTPLLGAVPVIGALFRSVRYERKETELVVLVTPVIVGGMNPAQVGPVPGQVWRDPTMASLFLMRDLGEDKTEIKADDMNMDSAAPVDSEKKSTASAAPAPATAPAPTYTGAYGFAPAAASTTTKPAGASATTTKPAGAK